VTGGFCSSTDLAPTETVAITNVAIGGLTTVIMRQMSDLSAGGQSQLYVYAPAAKWNILSFWGGTNDLCNGALLTPTQVLTNILDFVNNAAKIGWKVIIPTMISRTGTGTGGGTCDSLKNTLNGLLRSTIPTYLPGQVFLNDIATDANIGADGANTSATWFQSDHIHLTDTGYALVGTYTKNLINQITQAGGLLAEPTCTIAAKPTVPYVGQHCYFTDASSTTDCTSGSGTAKSFCMYNGSAWAKP
jgi:lysophospholipase L1-like esterase